MRNEYEMELKKIARMSGAMAAFSSFLALAMTIIIIASFVTLLSSPTSTADNYLQGVIVDIDFIAVNSGLFTHQDKIISMVYMLGIALIFAPFMVFFIKLLLCFRNNNLFTNQSVAYAKKIAWLTLSGIIFHYLWMFLAPAAFSVPERIYSFKGGLEFLALGILCLLVWILQVGKALQFDSEMSI